ncbi:MAG: aldo/keto reductase [Clostridia bacterium]|nr:aldo/keto reductase [Clostridia bacterium]
MSFEKISGKLGFGCMRLPVDDGKINYQKFCEMIDAYLENGFNYFDTARGYHGGQSESALRECLVKRHPRESYILTDKLSNDFFDSKEAIRPLFEEQLKTCGVEYFDFYLMHAQDEKKFKKYKECRAYETALELKAEGKIKHLGISFHDKASVLDKILIEYPEIEVVQIQFNYVDYNDPNVESGKCYEVCRKHEKPIIVMEPVKGGKLVNLPDDAKKILHKEGNGSIASYAIRYAASFDGVINVLSGMGNMDMLSDNMSYMKDFKPLDKAEFAAIDKVCSILNTQNLIPCTDCRYCVVGCPKNILIPNLFSCLNGKRQWNDWSYGYYYNVHTGTSGKASDCINCGKCEEICPQHLEIRKLLKEVAEEFENKND